MTFRYPLATKQIENQANPLLDSVGAIAYTGLALNAVLASAGDPSSRRNCDHLFVYPKGKEHNKGRGGYLQIWISVSIQEKRLPGFSKGPFPIAVHGKGAGRRAGWMLFNSTGGSVRRCFFYPRRFDDSRLSGYCLTKSRWRSLVRFRPDSASRLTSLWLAFHPGSRLKQSAERFKWVPQSENDRNARSETKSVASELEFRTGGYLRGGANILTIWPTHHSQKWRERSRTHSSSRFIHHHPDLEPVLLLAQPVVPDSATVAVALSVGIPRNRTVYGRP